MSASPAPSDYEEQQPQKAKKVTFRFCRECSNILYPKEDRESGDNRLIFQCRTCTGHEEADNACIYRNEMSNTAGETAGITQDVGQDPTLPRSSKTCPACGEQENVFFQSQQRTAETGMKNYYVCVHCGNVWQ